MLESKNIAVVVPAYNEAALIQSTLQSVPRFVNHIVVVDDASTDATIEAAETAGRPIELIRHEANRGVGAAIATGCRRALSLGAEFTAVMAADGQMDPKDLPDLLAPLLSGEADYVKGDRLSCPKERRAMPWHRWLGNLLFSSLTRRALGVDVQDSQCGYAAMNRRTKQTLDWDRLWNGYGYPNDLLAWLRAFGLRVRDVPVRAVYGAEQSGIRLHHVAVVIPFVIARAWFRRRAMQRAHTSGGSPATEAIRRDESSLTAS